MAIVLICESRASCVLHDDGGQVVRPLLSLPMLPGIAEALHQLCMCCSAVMKWVPPQRTQAYLKCVTACSSLSQPKVAKSWFKARYIFQSNCFGNPPGLPGVTLLDLLAEAGERE